jgi:phosphatidylserine decarboxylase
MCPYISVKDFAKRYNIDHKQVIGCEFDSHPSQCWSKFSSTNELFTRRRTHLPPSSSSKIEYKKYIQQSFYIATGTTLQPSVNIHLLIASPADCYTVLLNESTLRVWIKGSRFTPSELFKAVIPKSYYLLVCRLAPQHYHRFHCPVTGKITRIWRVGNKHYSVQRFIVNSKVNVFNENVRVVIDIMTNTGSIIHMAVIGATCVASIEFTNKSILSALGRTTGQVLTDEDFVNPVIFTKQPKIYMNDELGIFHFGGSSVALLLPQDIKPTRIFNHISYNTARRTPYETQLTVGDIIGQV